MIYLKVMVSSWCMSSQDSRSVSPCRTTVFFRSSGVLGATTSDEWRYQSRTGTKTTFHNQNRNQFIIGNFSVGLYIQIR